MEYVQRSHHSPILHLTGLFLQMLFLPCANRPEGDDACGIAYGRSGWVAVPRIGSSVLNH